MSDYITKVSVEDYEKKYSNYVDVSSLSSKEDIATFIDTFETSGILGCNINRVLDVKGKYLFVENKGKTTYDFFIELNKLSTLDVDITAENAKLLFPKSQSRGYLSIDEVNIPEVDDNISTGGVVVDEEAPTGFLDEDDLADLKGTTSDVSRLLIHIKKGTRLPISDDHGIVFGRSMAQSEYVIANNKVSRQHAKVYKNMSTGKIMVHDFGSVNGTFIDGLKVRPEYDREIPVGSSLLFADEEFKLV